MTIDQPPPKPEIDPTPPNWTSSPTQAELGRRIDTDIMRRLQIRFGQFRHKTTVDDRGWVKTIELDWPLFLALVEHHLQ